MTTQITGNLLDNDLLPIVPQPVADPDRARYHVGIRTKGGTPPAWDLSLGGISFPVYSSFWDDHDNEFKRAGAVVDLDLEQLQRIKDAIRHRIVRWRKNREDKRIRAEIWDIRILGFRAEAGDEALAPYLYLRPAPEDYIQPGADADVLLQLDRALQEGARSEEKAARDPEDAKVREKHARHKASGTKVDDSL